jgi:hypothetical protein
MDAGRRGSEQVSERDAFTPEQWRTLEFAPFWVLSVLVGAYDRWDPRDYQAFMRCLEVAAMTEDRLVREVVASILADPEGLLRAFRADQRTIAVGFVQVSTVLDRVVPAQAAGFKATVHAEIGEGLARARGRYGSEISDDDAKTLTLAAAMLSLDYAGQA